MACGGLSRVSSLAQATGLSPRQFERRFASHVGLAPKSFLRVVRFQQVLKAIDAGAAPDWSRLAVDHGFYDQPQLREPSSARLQGTRRPTGTLPRTA